MGKVSDIIICVVRMVFAVCAFCVCMPIMAERQYAEKSVLASGKWIKIKVKEEGIYQYTFSQLKSMGFKDPTKVRLYGYGGELIDRQYNGSHYIDDLPEVPTMVVGERILFYLRGTIGFRSNSALTYTTFAPLYFEENYVSDYSYYFLTEGNETPKRIETVSDSTDAYALSNEDIKTHLDIKYTKYDEYNLLQSGRNWCGNKMTPGQSKTFSFNFDNQVDGGLTKIMAVMVSAATSTPTFKMKTNHDSLTKTTSTLTSSVKGREAPLGLYHKQKTGYPASATISFECSSPTAAAYCDFVQASAECWINVADRKTLFIRRSNTSASVLKDFARYCVAGVDDATVVLKVTHADSISRKPMRIEGDTGYFVIRKAGTRHPERMVIFNTNMSFDTPETEGEVANQNLHEMRNIEYIVLAPKEFLTYANRLADLHAEKDGLSTAVLTTDVIYNEFSSGTPDPTAIRAFMKMLFDRGGRETYGIRPRYLLFYGDGIYDALNRSKSQLNSQYNKLITYETEDSYDEGYSHTCDDYFTYLNDNASAETLNSQNIMCMGVGRLPVSTDGEAQAVLDKIERYMQNDQMGEWKNKIVLMADDNNEYSTDSQYHLFTKYAEELAGTIEGLNLSVDVKRIYWDSYERAVSSGANRYPGVERDIKDNINNGALIMNYVGHSSYNSMSGEYVFSLSDAISLYNKKMPVWISSSCNIAQFDAYKNALGEDMLLSKNGGVIAFIGPVRTAYASQNQKFNLEVIKALLNPDNGYVIGDVMREAKNNRGKDSNKLVYALLGDPAMRILMPQYEVLTDSAVMYSDKTTKADTFGALAKVMIYGSVVDETRKVMSDFNGRVRIMMKDKKQKVRTRANNSGVNPYTYYDNTNMLFSGSAEVRDGKFCFSMIVPKDINYSMGHGRLSYYAYDTENEYEAIGADTSYTIGGSAGDIAWEEAGPRIRLYMNTTGFTNGDEVNDTPMLYAALSDENGINASGCGIGHDITVSIDGGEPINVNECFVYDQGSCTEGVVKYHLSELSSGKHSLTLKAWDMLNNSNESSISFRVGSDIAPEVDIVSAYPVPAKDNVTLSVWTDRPDEVLEVEHRVFDMNGEVHYFNETTEKGENGEFKIEWDLKGGAGNRLPGGTYIYHIAVKTSGSESAEATKKFIILPQ